MAAVFGACVSAVRFALSARVAAYLIAEELRARGGGAMRTIEWRDEVKRDGWGAGAWDGEPDRAQWLTAAGLPGLAVRTDYGHWCGYVGVPEGHRLHGTDYDDTNLAPYDGPHGGLTYASRCAGRICHEVEPGEADGVWWFGFDCAHYRDFSPGYAVAMRAVDSLLGGRLESVREGPRGYRSLAYVRAEVEGLASALAGVAP